MQKFTARILDTVIDEYFSYSVYAVCQHDALMQCEKIGLIFQYKTST